MGLVDAFGAEDRVNVKFSDFYNLVKGCTQRDMLMNAVRCKVPHCYTLEVMTGEENDEALEERNNEAKRLIRTWEVTEAIRKYFGQLYKSDEEDSNGDQT